MSATTGDDWRQLAEAARDEEDPKRLMQLITELNRRLEERTRDMDGSAKPVVD